MANGTESRPITLGTIATIVTVLILLGGAIAAYFAQQASTQQQILSLDKRLTQIETKILTLIETGVKHDMEVDALRKDETKRIWSEITRIRNYLQEPGPK